MHAAVLRYFDQVARLGSIRRAAEALHVASSAVNRQIIKLEEEIGTPLFERLRSGVRLTAAGEVLLRHVARNADRFRAHPRSRSPALPEPSPAMCASSRLESLLLRFMPQVVAELAEAHPQMTLTVVGIDPGDTAEEMRSGRNDFGVLFVDRRHARRRRRREFPTSIGAVMRPDHPLAARRTLTFTDCAGLSGRDALRPLAARPHHGDGIRRIGRAARAAHRLELDRLHAPDHRARARHRLLHADRLHRRDRARRARSCGARRAAASPTAPSPSWCHAAASPPCRRASPWMRSAETLPNSPSGCRLRRAGGTLGERERRERSEIGAEGGVIFRR